jgi:O-antigen/teichoic acid export membrane protein
VTLSLYIVGLDFYGYTQRELIAAALHDRGWITKQHMLVMLLSACCILPLIAAAQCFLPLGPSLALWLVVIVFVEHLGQEFLRLLIACGAPLQASIVNALRTAAWGPPVLLLMLADSSFANLDTVFCGWLLGGLLALGYGVYVVRKLNIGGWSRPTGPAWMRRGFVIALPLLAATIALRALFTLDRYILEWIGDVERLAAYTLFTTLAGGLIGLADATFNVFSYPVLVDAHSRGDRNRFVAELRGFFIAVTVFALCGSALLYVCLPLLLDFLADDAYGRHALMFPWVLAGVIAYLMSTVVHYGLFAARRDAAIFLANVLALACLPLAVILLENAAVMPLIPIAMFLSFMMLFLIKSALLAGAFKKNVIVVGA